MEITKSKVVTNWFYSFLDWQSESEQGNILTVCETYLPYIFGESPNPITSRIRFVATKAALKGARRFKVGEFGQLIIKGKEYSLFPGTQRLLKKLYDEGFRYLRMEVAPKEEPEWASSRMQ